MRQKEKTKAMSFMLPVVFFLTIILVLIFGQVFVSNHFITSGQSIAGFEKEVQKLSQENERLEQEIASSSSLLTIEVKAKELGFTESTSFISIPQNLPVAFEL